MPIITLEVMSDSSNADQTTTYDYVPETPTNNYEEGSKDGTGVHFLTEKMEDEELNPKVDNEDDKEATPKARNDLLEYMTRNDGSVICKLCGEILQSRTHWYRHKYKLHRLYGVPPLNPAPLFQCEQCLVYFKSRKGYIGHIASRHSELLSDSSPVLTNSQAAAESKEHSTNKQSPPEVSEEPDPEQAIPKTSVPNYQTTSKTVSKTTDIKKPCRTKESPKSPDWEEKRSREEKLVADIIDRVRRECEAQGGSGSTRRGYSRRTTIMHL